MQIPKIRKKYLSYKSSYSQCFKYCDSCCSISRNAEASLDILVHIYSHRHNASSIKHVQVYYHHYKEVKKIMSLFQVVFTITDTILIDQDYCNTIKVHSSIRPWATRQSQEARSVELCLHACKCPCFFRLKACPFKHHLLLKVLLRF